MRVGIFFDYFRFFMMIIVFLSKFCYGYVFIFPGKLLLMDHYVNDILWGHNGINDIIDKILITTLSVMNSIALILLFAKPSASSDSTLKSTMCSLIRKLVLSHKQFHLMYWIFLTFSRYIKKKYFFYPNAPWNEVQKRWVTPVYPSSL